MTDDVDQDQSDFSGISRWALMWQAIFFVMDLVVMAISLVLNLCLLRGMARNPQKETTVYWLLMWLFFTSLVDDALLVGQFIKLYNTDLIHSTALCQFETFVVLGNRVLQVLTLLFLVYYAWIQTEFKKTAIENKTKQFLPLVILTLVLAEVLVAIGPAMNVRSQANVKKCYYVDDSAYTRSVTGWLYLVIFPYFLPLVLASFPMIRIAMKLRNASYQMTEYFKIQNYVVLSVAGGYFLFHLMYYLMSFGSYVYILADGVEGLRMIFYKPVWFILRPMFALIGYGWHIVTPLSPFIFDKDFLDVFPGKYVNRKRLEVREDTRHDIVLTPKSSWSNMNNNAASTEFHNPVTANYELDEREYNQSVA